MACSKSESPATPAASETEKAAMSIQISSTAFTEGNPIPVEFTCDGSDVSPELKWTGVPTGAKSLALICDDPDAPGGTFVHWVIYGIPPGENQLGKSVPTTPTLGSGAKQGKNGFGTIGYRGPCPPRGGPHRYFFRIYALDTTIDEASGVSRAQLDRAMKGHVVGEGHLMGKYQRGR
jgi:Raf kinase inhibitor-like YbhB/YbcL family protein